MWPKHRSGIMVAGLIAKDDSKAAPGPPSCGSSWLVLRRRPQASFAPRRQRLRPGQCTRLALQHIQIVFEIEHLLVTLRAALMKRDYAPFVANLNMAGVQPHLHRPAWLGGDRIEIRPHPHATQPIDPREANLRQLEALLSQRQQIGALLDHRCADRLTAAGYQPLVIIVAGSY